jgi:2-polyprenyl-3-methyl-5-hydroxy-6-metoxy-1,4-benzoquinol methylase
MEYMGNAVWWDKRFEDRALRQMNHEKALEEDMKCFPERGNILDVASGDGRNSIYFAKLGYSVTSIDFSEEALKRLNYFAEQEKLTITTKLVDVANNQFCDALGEYNGIIINHYRLKASLYEALMNHLNDGGVLWVNGFREVPLDNPNIKERDILVEEDFSGIHPSKRIKKVLYDIEESKFIRCIWRK